MSIGMGCDSDEAGVDIEFMAATYVNHDWKYKRGMATYQSLLPEVQHTAVLLVGLKLDPGSSQGCQACRPA